jgi:hypothetical protein
MFKRQTATGEYSHVYSRDRAVDVEASAFDHEQFLKTADSKFLPLKNGGQPVEFLLNHCGWREKAVISGLFSKYSEEEHLLLFYELVSLCLVGIRNGAYVEDGKTVEVERAYDKKRNVNVADKDSMDALCSVDGGSLLIEIGNRIIKETFPADPLS